MKADVKRLELVELMALHQFVASKPFSANPQAKKIINERLAEIEDELLDRAFGLNPYKAGKQSIVEDKTDGVVVVKYEGQDPIKVMGSDTFKTISGPITAPVYAARTVEKAEEGDK